jgi:LysM repeat protein
VSTLRFGVFLTPIQVDAGFLSSLLGNEVSASTETTTGNSQNMNLLQANVSSAPVFKDKKTTKDAKDEISTIEDNGNKNILSESALNPVTGPLGVTDGTEVVESSPDDISVYVVRKGDSISQIAEMFDVSVSTILSANDMKKGQKLVEGDVLFILPISGVRHTVVKGQTLRSIAKLYKIDVSDIVFYNGISEDSKLAIGDELVIPGAEMYEEGGDKPAPNLNSSIAKDKNYYETHPIANLIGYFINPVPTGRKTQGLHGPGHRGIDIGAPTGTNIYASAEGVVIATKTGCKVKQTRCGGGYGNLVIVQHPNGTKTLYAHMSKLNTTNGARVAKGEVIGYVGNTGRSTGPHIHFEVFNAKNPGSDWSWANQSVVTNQ